MTSLPNTTDGGRGIVDVLIIDDNADIRSVLGRTLSRAGYNVLSCAEGNGALRLLAQRSFRLVITDIFMPDVDGYEVIKTVNASQPKPQVLAISGGTLSVAGVNLRVAKHLGCRVLAKPFDLPEFYSVVREMIGAPQSETDPVPVQ
jgi:two-component system cell cycle response regulator CpdR